MYQVQGTKALRVIAQELTRLDQKALFDWDVPVAAYGSQIDHARLDANDDNEAEWLLCLQGLEEQD